MKLVPAIQDELMDDEIPKLTARQQAARKRNFTTCICCRAWDDQSLKEGCSGMSHSSISTDETSPDPNWKHSASGRVEIPSNNTTRWTFRIDEKMVMFCGILVPSMRSGPPVNASIHFNNVDDLTGPSYFVGRFSTSRFLIRIFSGGTDKEVAQIEGEFKFSENDSQSVCDHLSGVEVVMSASSPSFLPSEGQQSEHGREFSLSCSLCLLTDAMDVIGVGFWVTS
ncbi:hypothetical protein ACEPAG_8376 [Sanghuangporus baumii]